MATSIAIIGAGGWGTALAVTLARVHRDVRLWVFEPELADILRRERVNPIYLAGIEVPKTVRITDSLGEALEGATIVISAIPSHVFRGVWENMASELTPEMRFVTATKGIETTSLMRMSEVIVDVVGAECASRTAVLSGPTFAQEVARGKPTALVVASGNRNLRSTLQKELSAPNFRLYTNADMTGVEIGGAVKNIIAIAAGIVSGLNLGHNATAALVTRGLAEIMRLAVASGGKRNTLAGLAGLGDLVLTCTGQLSRNRKVGVALGEGQTKDQIIVSMRMVAEGIRTSESTITLAGKLGIEMPIAQQVFSVLYEGKDVHEAIRELMERELTEE